MSFESCCDRFNFTTREFVKHIMPIFLTRALAGVQRDSRTENLAFGIQLKRTRQKKDADKPTKSEIKITFSPLPLVEIDLSHQPQDEDWANFAAKDGTPYDPTDGLDCDILECFLRHGLPTGTLKELAESTKSAKRKRNDQGVTSDSPSTSKRCKKGSRKSFQPTEDCDDESPQSDVLRQVPDKPAPQKRGRPKKDTGTDVRASDPAESKRKGAKDAGCTTQIREPPPPPVFKLPKAIPRQMQCDTDIIDRHTGGSASRLHSGQSSYAETRPVISPPPPLRANPTSEKALVPGTAIPRETLRLLRARSTLLCSPVDTTASLAPNPLSRRVRPPNSTLPEIIDLT